jgi:hypothetical protein
MQNIINKYSQPHFHPFPNKYIPKYNLIEEKFKHGKQGLYFKVYVLADYNNK